MTSTPTRTEARSGTLGGEREGWVERCALVAFIAVPFLAILAAVPVAWGGWLGWSDVLLSFVFCAVAGHGITVGFHRYLTHGSFKAKRPLRVSLTVAGSMAIEGPAVRWVADRLFDVEQTSQRQYAPDLLNDPDIVKVSRAFFWAGLVRVGLLHHATWSINSIYHGWASPGTTRTTPTRPAHAPACSAARSTPVPA